LNFNGFSASPLQVADRPKKPEENFKCAAFVKQLAHATDANEEVREGNLLVFQLVKVVGR
jgi:hypothetical protein